MKGEGGRQPPWFEATAPTLQHPLRYNTIEEEDMTQHAQMTADEWVDDWVAEAIVDTNTNPVATHAEVPPIPKGAAVANVAGGVYFATATEISDVLAKYGTPGGQKLRTQLYKVVGHDPETHHFYRDATLFEAALVLAWHTSVLNKAPYYM